MVVNERRTKQRRYPNRLQKTKKLPRICWEQNTNYLPIDIAGIQALPETLHISLVVMILCYLISLYSYILCLCFIGYILLCCCTALVKINKNYTIMLTTAIIIITIIIVVKLPINKIAGQYNVPVLRIFTAFTALLLPTHDIQGGPKSKPLPNYKENRGVLKRIKLE